MNLHNFTVCPNQASLFNGHFNLFSPDISLLSPTFCWSSEASTRYFPKEVSSNRWNQSSTWRTACFCLQLFPVPITLILLPSPPPPISLSLPLHVVPQKQLWKVFFFFSFFFFWSPSKRGAKTHGCCAASLLCAKGRVSVHDKKGRTEGLEQGADLVRQTSFLPSR